MTSTPKVHTALAQSSSYQSALAEIQNDFQQNQISKPDILLCFFSAELIAHAEEIAAELNKTLEPKFIAGCSGESVIGNAIEVELEPAISVVAISHPTAKISQMNLEYDRSTDGGRFKGWPDELIANWPEDSIMILLGDPFSFPTDLFLERMNEDRKGSPVVGGMASGGGMPGDTKLISGGQVLNSGAVAIHISGVPHRTIVSQGCRPVGDSMVITKAEANEILELGGKPAMLQLGQLFESLPTSDQAKVEHGLHVGLVINEYQEKFQQGDFLIRNVVGLDPDRHSVTIAEYPRVGQTMRFQIRDDVSAKLELTELLQKVKRDESFSPIGGLAFSCNGRGTRMFSEPHHDAQLIRKELDDLPLAGFFAGGEIGPVCGRNFVHGYTVSLLVLGE